MWYGGEKSMGDINAKTSAILLYDYAKVAVGLDTPVHHKLSTKEDILEFIGQKNEQNKQVSKIKRFFELLHRTRY